MSNLYIITNDIINKDRIIIERPIQKRKTNLVDKLGKVIGEQIESWTTHGLPNVIRSKYISVKIIWTILFLTAIGFSIYFLYNTINEYLEFNVTTEVRLINVNELEFPVITICDRNMASNYNGVQYLRNLFNSTGILFDDFNFKRYYDYITKEYAFKYFYPIPIKDRKSLSANISQILSAGVYGNEIFDNYQLKEDDFEWIFNPYFGNCYRYNTDSKMKSKANIPCFLSMNLYSPLPDIFEFLNKKQSLFIQVSSKRSNPFKYLDDAVEISTGVKSMLKISKSVYNKQKRPYSDCDLAEDSNGNLMYPSNFDRKYFDQIKTAGYEYSQSLCISFCQLDKIGNNCTFRASSINAPNNIDNFCPDKKIKPFKDDSTISGLFSKYFYNLAVDEDCVKLCPKECKTEKYDTFLTNSDLEMSRSNFIELRIHFDSISYLNYKESPSISIYNLVSNIGGVVGLMLGMMISVIN
jgi:hypothetical protein